MTDVVALLDRPSRESMGAVPFVSGGHGPVLAVQGLAQTSEQSIADDDLQQLVASHQAIAFRPPVAIDLGPAVANPVAMWIGREFEAKASNLGVPAPPLPSDQVVNLPDGRAALANPGEVYARLETWIERAFRTVVEEPNEPLARLMAQVLPIHDLTQAALWCSAESGKRRAQELDWFLRLRRDAGRPTSKRTLERHFETLRANPPWTRVKFVVLVSGLTGTRHSEAAERITRTMGAHVHDSSMVSFGGFLRKRWEELHGQPATKPDLQRFGQEQVNAGPFLFARQVLAQMHTYPELLVVDGVRHRTIKDAIEFILHKPTLPFAVDTPEPVVVKHLADDNIRAEELPQVRAAQTENEAKKLLQQVGQRISYTDSDNDNQSEVQRVSDLALQKFAAAG
jgi:hypothetical protein